MAALLRALADTWRDVRAASGRLDKRRRMARLFAELEGGDLTLAATYLAGEPPQVTGAGWALVSGALEKAGATVPPPLALREVADTLDAIAGASGPGSIKLRGSLLRGLFARAEADERELLAGVLLGELRQGALRALVIEALAEARGAAVDELRRAVMLAGSLGAVVEALASEGTAALARFTLTPLVPVEPMLASTAADVTSALAELGGRAAVEWKLDGVRVQVHRLGDEVRVFTRSLRDVTAGSPALTALARSLPSTSFILDGEAIALGPDLRPIPFQDLMSQFQDEENPGALEALFFDVLFLDGEPLVDRPCHERRVTLERLAGESRCVPRRVAASPEEAAAVLEEALRLGHEGVLVKALDAPYAAGRRGSLWKKVKPAHTVDLVILAAEWGHGRRRGLLSNLHLGARDPEDPGRFWMLGKTFKGLTDAMLRELTVDLQAIAVEQNDFVVKVRPERVVEIAFDGIQRSTRYESGLALRFARVKRFRPDKRATDATTLEEVRRLGG